MTNVSPRSPRAWPDTWPQGVDRPSPTLPRPTARPHHPGSRILRRRPRARPRQGPRCDHPGRDDGCHARSAAVEPQDAAQQRSPREGDRDVRSASPASDRAGVASRRRPPGTARPVSGRGRRVGTPRPSPPPTRRRRSRASRAQPRLGRTDRPSPVPRNHDHPLEAGDQAGDLADVDLEGTTPDDLAHGPQSTLGP